VWENDCNSTLLAPDDINLEGPCTPLVPALRFDWAVPPGQLGALPRTFSLVRITRFSTLRTHGFLCRWLG